MSSKNRALFGIYAGPSDAENAVSQLKMAGFRNTDLSMLFPENEGTKDLAWDKTTKSSEGALAGAGIGLIVGGALGWIAGSGMLALPYLGMLLTAGPIMSLLSGIGVGGVIGGLIGALIGLASPRYEAKRYQGRVRRGAILLSVHCDDSDWAKTAQAIVEQTGAEGISITREAKADFATSDRPRHRTIETRAS